MICNTINMQNGICTIKCTHQKNYLTSTYGNKWFETQFASSLHSPDLNLLDFFFVFLKNRRWSYLFRIFIFILFQLMIRENELKEIVHIWVLNNWTMYESVKPKKMFKMKLWNIWTFILSTEEKGKYPEKYWVFHDCIPILFYLEWHEESIAVKKSFFTFKIK